MKPPRLFLYLILLLCSIALAHPGYQEQLQQLTYFIEQQPREQVLYLRRGALYTEGNQFQQAMADLKRAEKLGAPERVAFEWGMLYHRMKNFALSIDYYDQYIKRFPRDARAYELRARVERDAGDAPRAVADLQHYFALLEQPHPGNYLAAAALLTAMDETQQALQLLDDGMQKLGLTPQLQRQAIALELKRDHIGRAIARLETLRVPLKENPDWKLEMAELLVRAGRATEATALLNAADAELAERRSTPAHSKLLQQSQRLREHLTH